MSEVRKAAFIEALRTNGGIARAAAQVASPGAKNAIRTFYDLRDRDPEFAQEWADAIEEANAALESEIHRRGVEGFVEERIDGAGRVTQTRRYSDACLLAMARARLPGYAKSEVNLSGKIETNDTLTAELAAAVKTVAATMAPALTKGLEKVANEALNGD